MEHRTLGQRYELVEQLGQGGMGTVYRAVDHRLRRTVAVKTLSAELVRQPQFLARFQREAHAAAALNHPGVATVYDVGEDAVDGFAAPYLVMEYVEGRTLAHELRDGPLPAEQAADVAGQVLEALRHSHGHGIVHRDIKPANVMLTRAGTAKILDFGIAKALSEVATRLTGTGVAVGTPAYLAPEQIEGRDTDHRTDLYAVGCLLYELLTGRPPYTGESPFSVMHQHLVQEPVPPSLLRPGLSPGVDAVVLRALRKRREDRFADAAEMKSELERVAQTPMVPAMPTPTEVDRPAPQAQPESVEAVRRDEAATGADRVRSLGRVVFRPTPEGMVALLGSTLAVVVSRSEMISTEHFPLVALLGGLAGCALLLWSARLACAVAWAPVAEAVAVWSEFSRANVGWETRYVVIALLLGLVAGLCLVAGYRDERSGGFALVAFWFTGLTSVWFFLDDLRKIGVFYVVLLGVCLALGAQTLKTRLAESGRPAVPVPERAAR
ncbi:protein kinase domain-containing protein [Streptomyces broussonetiae]|uniref:non-specific serine/threonine protein kinase n=1 Tax=Streptomyces broussonetiae TaxID=2686304 RepID=A0A6I6NCM6_9ACTN|nr:protein kinase [Streptomyces broussonetiae]QHA05897.1 protein kinase [Streptomyces broussonetiae]